MTRSLETHPTAAHKRAYDAAYRVLRSGGTDAAAYRAAMRAYTARQSGPT